MTFLKTAPDHPKIDVAKAMAAVERTHRVGRYRQLREIARACLGAQKMTLSEYYEYGVFNPDLTTEEKARLVSERSNTAYNSALSPVDLGAVPAVMRDKALCGRILAGFGFPVPEVLALYSRDGRYGRLNGLRSAADIAAFLGDNDRWPLFAKPTIAGMGIGAASFIGRDGDVLILGTGDGVAVSDFATFVAEAFPDGYVFQEFLRQDPRIEAVTGPAVGVVRIVTVRTQDGPAFLYGAWKFPGAGAMSDGLQKGATPTGMGLIDPKTGIVTAAHFGNRLFGRDGAISPVTGSRIAGTEVAHFDACRALAVEAHHVFPTHGVVGWDMIVTPDGPVIGEANPNPFHQVVQRATGRPLSDPDALEVEAAAKAFVKKRRAEAFRPGAFQPWKI